MFPKIRDMAPPKSKSPATVLFSIVGTAIGVFLVQRTLPNGTFQVPWVWLKDVLDMVLILAGAGVGFIFGHVFGSLIDMRMSPKVVEVTQDCAEHTDTVVDTHSHGESS